jgi:hypothetical protein
MRSPLGGVQWVLLLPALFSPVFTAGAQERAPADLLLAGAIAVFDDDFETGECAMWSATTNPLAAPDSDVDDFGDETLPTVHCQLPDGFLLDLSDCDDSDPDVNPGATELCNGVDDDCDDATDARDRSLELALCENQNGVCGGATKPAGLCAGGFWGACGPAHYGAHSPSYEPVETSCDSLDNDCDGIPDEASVLDTDPICIAATELGSVDGDTGAQQVTTGHHQERFYLIRVEEALGAGSVDLQVRVDLDVPAGLDYDLYAYCASCGASAMQSANGAGQDEVLEVGRDDVGGDQSFWLIVEVRYVGGSNSCANWALVVTGNQPTVNRACNG